jgi:hypothetical protein
LAIDKHRINVETQGLREEGEGREGEGKKGTQRRESARTQRRREGVKNWHKLGVCPRVFCQEDFAEFVPWLILPVVYQ